MKRKKHDFQRDEKTPALFDDGGPLASNIAWACAVYSMVPYLGILFVPFTFVFTGLEWFAVQPGQERGNRRTPLVLLAVTMLILAAQLVLWALLYLIPKIGI